MARDLGINDTTLGTWVKADQAERGVPAVNGLLPLTAAERAELTKLRRDNARLRVEREMLKGGGLLRDGVEEVTRTRDSIQHIIEVSAALRSLESVPVPALERMLAATVDCSSHRIGS